MRIDPTDNAGLFIGQRSSTGPIDYAAEPRYGSPLRRRVDRGLSVAIVGLMVVVCVLACGAAPLGWLWVASQVEYLTKDTFIGIVVAFMGMLSTLLLGLVAIHALDRPWILVRRAAGHAQREGVATRVFAVCAVIAGTVFVGWLFLTGGLNPSLAPIR